MRDNTDIPILDGYNDGKQYYVWCPCCTSFHLHGFLPDHKDSPTHRIAHCIVEKSPYNGRGYMIQYKGEFIKEVKKLYKAHKPFYCIDCNECISYNKEFRALHQCKLKGAHRRYEAQLKRAGAK